LAEAALWTSLNEAAAAILGLPDLQPGTLVEVRRRQIAEYIEDALFEFFFFFFLRAASDLVNQTLGARVRLVCEIKRLPLLVFFFLFYEVKCLSGCFL
jgi:hypothetical protein